MLLSALAFFGGVALPTAASAAIRIVALEAPTAGDTEGCRSAFQASFTLTADSSPGLNQGTFHFHYCPSDSLDSCVAQRDHDIYLTEGTTERFETTLGLPDSAEVGTRFIRITTDTPDAPDHTLYDPIEVTRGPDLYFSTAYSIPDLIASGRAEEPGDRFRMHATIANAFGTSRLGTDFDVGYYFCRTTSRVTCTRMNSERLSINLNCGMSIQYVTTVLQIPCDAPQGQAYILAVADDSGEIAEDIESNNGRYNEIRIERRPTCGNGVVEESLECPSLSESCEDGNTTDGDCCSSACKIDPDGRPCDDRDYCTQLDTCSSGACVGGNPVACPSLGPCYESSMCDPATGWCSAPAPFPDGTPCSDDTACTRFDRCTAGACSGEPVENCCRVDDDCQDNAGCNGQERCDSLTGTCRPGDALDCNDGNSCTLDRCAETVDGPACVNCVPLPDIDPAALDDCAVALESTIDDCVSGASDGTVRNGCVKGMIGAICPFRGTGN